MTHDREIRPKVDIKRGLSPKMEHINAASRVPCEFGSDKSASVALAPTIRTMQNAVRRIHVEDLLRP